MTSSPMQPMSIPKKPDINPYFPLKSCSSVPRSPAARRSDLKCSGAIRVLSGHFPGDAEKGQGRGCRKGNWTAAARSM